MKIYCSKNLFLILQIKVGLLMLAQAYLYIAISSTIFIFYLVSNLFPKNMQVLVLLLLLNLLLSAASAIAATSTEQDVDSSSAVLRQIDDNSIKTKKEKETEPAYWNFNACSDAKATILVRQTTNSVMRTTDTDAGSEPEIENDATNPIVQQITNSVTQTTNTDDGSEPEIENDAAMNNETPPTLNWSELLKLLMNSIKDIAAKLGIDPSLASDIRKVLELFISEQDTVLQTMYDILDLFAKYLALPTDVVATLKLFPIQETAHLLGALAGQVGTFPTIHPAFIQALKTFEQVLKNFLTSTNPNDGFLKILEMGPLVKIFPVQELYSLTYSCIQQLKNVSRIENTFVAAISVFAKGLDDFFDHLSPPLEASHVARQFNGGIQFLVDTVQSILIVNDNPTLPNLLRMLASKFRGDDSTLSWLQVTFGSWLNGVDNRLLNQITFYLDVIAK